MYLTGEGTARSEEKAIYWYLRLGATTTEYARPARTRLLMMTRNYAFGEGGVKRDEQKARELFTRLFKMEQEGQAELMPEPVRTATTR
jgi:TPR repeat protein